MQVYQLDGSNGDEMKYELINENQIKAIKNIFQTKEIDNVIQNYNVSNPTDELLDELNIGMYLDETAIIPEYDFSTQYLKNKYSMVDNKIKRDFEICDIVLSEMDVLKNQVNRVDSAFDEFMTIVLPEVLI